MIYELNPPIRERDAVLPASEPRTVRQHSRPGIVTEYIPSSCGNCGACDCIDLTDDGTASCGECGTRFSLRVGDDLHVRD